MANRTDPLVNAVSGTDPQNLLEYILRQKIYDSRFWKEECFGLSVEDVLEKAATGNSALNCIGGHSHSRFLALTLKLLQLHPETDLIVEAFIEQDDFKYVRALGCLYLRLTGRPADIYETLEPLYSDRRKLRHFEPSNPLQPWKVTYFDEFVHDLLTQPRAVNIALPRLPARETLVEAGYLPDEPRRPTALNDLLKEYHNNDPLTYLKYKARVERCSAAIRALEDRKRNKKMLDDGEVSDGRGYDNNIDNGDANDHEEDSRNVVVGRAGGLDKKELSAENEPGSRKSGSRDDGETDGRAEDNDESRTEKRGDNRKHSKKKKKKERNYDNLFKKGSGSGGDSMKKKTKKKHTEKAEKERTEEEEQQSEEYWNEQRAKLGLKPLQK